MLANQSYPSRLNVELFEQLRDKIKSHFELESIKFQLDIMLYDYAVDELVLDDSISTVRPTFEKLIGFLTGLRCVGLIDWDLFTTRIRELKQIHYYQ